MDSRWHWYPETCNATMVHWLEREQRSSDKYGSGSRSFHRSVGSPCGYFPSEPTCWMDTAGCEKSEGTLCRMKPCRPSHCPFPASSFSWSATYPCWFSFPFLHLSGVSRQTSRCLVAWESDKGAEWHIVKMSKLALERVSFDSEKCRRPEEIEYIKFPSFPTPWGVLCDFFLHTFRKKVLPAKPCEKPVVSGLGLCWRSCHCSNGWHPTMFTAAPPFSSPLPAELGLCK